MSTEDGVTESLFHDIEESVHMKASMKRKQVDVTSSKQDETKLRTPTEDDKGKSSCNSPMMERFVSEKLDEKQIQADITSCKNSRKAVAGWLTRTRRDIEQGMPSLENLCAVEENLEKYGGFLEDLNKYHETLLILLSDGDRKNEVQQYKEKDAMNFDFLKKIKTWLNNARNKFNDQVGCHTIDDGESLRRNTTA